MNKNETLKKVNKMIDNLIIKGKTKTEEFKRLCELHTKIRIDMGLIKK